MKEAIKKIEGAINPFIYDQLHWGVTTPSGSYGFTQLHMLSESYIKYLGKLYGEPILSIELYDDDGVVISYPVIEAQK